MKFVFLIIAILFNFFNHSLINSEENIDSAKNKIENIARKESINEEKTEIKKIHIVKSGDTISSISATVFRSATFQVQVTRGTQYHMTTINVIHNGTVAFMSEYGTIRTGAVLATFDADVNSGNLRLRATPTSADSTVFKLSKTTVKV